MVAVPAGYDDLLERPLYGHLATTRPDGAVRGDVERIEPDPAASFFRRIANRYSGDEPPPDAPPRGEAPSDAPDWVVIVVRPTGFSKH